MPETPSSETPKTDGRCNRLMGKGQPKHWCGKPGRSGPPLGTRNNLRHGLKAGKLPPHCQYIEHRLNRFRRMLEDAVVAVRGEVSITDAGLIQSALRWERHAALALRWLRLKQDELSPADLLRFSAEIAKASTARDKALAALNLDAQPSVPWIDATPVHENGKETDGGTET